MRLSLQSLCTWTSLMLTPACNVGFLSVSDKIPASKVEVLGDGATTAVKPLPQLADRESNYQSFFRTQVEPWWNQGTTGTFAGKDGISLAYRKFSNPVSRLAMVVLHGKAENMTKYRETAYDFYQQGYSVYLMDLRGHGASQRITKEHGMVHVDSFHDYVADLHIFLKDIVAADQPSTIFAFAHSMGGGVTAGYLESDLSPKIARAVLSTPLLETNTGIFPQSMAMAIAWSGTRLGFGQSYAVTQGAPDILHPEFHGAGTASQPRFDLYHHDVIELFHQGTDLSTGGASYRWVEASLKFTAEVTQPEAAAKATIPILVSQVDNDSWVLPSGQNRFCAAAPQCTLVRVQGAKHEIWFDRDIYRVPYMSRVIAFFAENRPTTVTGQLPIK